MPVIAGGTEHMTKTELHETDLFQISGGLKPDWKKIVDDAISNMKDYGQSKETLLNMLKRNRGSIDISIATDEELNTVIDYINASWD